MIPSWYKVERGLDYGYAKPPYWYKPSPYKRKNWFKRLLAIGI